MLDGLKGLIQRIRSSVHRRDFEDDLDQELSFHLQMEVEKNIALGMTTERARQEAGRSFGGVLRTKEDVRSSRGLALIDGLGRDLLDAKRALFANALGSAVIIGTLALGIGANTAIFSAIYGVLLRPLPFDDGDRLVLLTQSAPAAGVEDTRFSVAEVEQYIEETESFESLVEYHTMPFILLGGEEPVRVQTGVVSAEFFDVLGVEPHLGRMFLLGEDEPGAEAVLVVSYHYWRSHLGGDADVIGAMLEMNDRPHRVVGVLPPLPDFPDRNDVYMPLSACPFRAAPAFLASRGSRMMRVLGRLKPNVSLDEARVDAGLVAARMVRTYPDIYPTSRGHVVRPSRLHDELTRTARPTLLLLLATAGCVLLIACANVANVTLSRVLRRRRELELRHAVGASRGRIARQLLVEATVLAVLGGALGLALAGSSLGLIVDYASRFTPRASEIALDGVVLLFTLAISAVTGLAFGTLPAFLPRVQVRGQRLRRALVTAQVAASLVLLATAGLMLRSLLHLERIDPGFDSEHVLTMLVDLNWSKYDDTGPVRGFHEKLLREIEAHPSVVSAAISRTFPLARGEVPQQARFQLAEASEQSRVLDVHAVSREYFRAIGVPLVRGRFFSPRDKFGSPAVVLINQAAAVRYWPDTSPVGESLVAGKDSAEIVGVVDDVRQYRLDAPAAPTAYVSIEQFPLRVSHLVVRTRDEPARVSEELISIVHGIDPDQAVASVKTFDNVRSESLAAPRLTTSLLSLFAALALAITIVGLSGVLAVSVSQRESELGIRIALGATRARVLAIVMREALALIALGIALGALGVLPLRSLLSGHLFEVEPTDPATLAAVCTLLVAAAAAACVIPARRAANIDPITILRTD